MSELVNLRNDISGRTETYTAEAAQRILSHPVFGKYNKVVRTAKPEVLAHPRPAASEEREPAPRRRYTKKEAE